ncbi:MAG: hypothetical protein E6J90_35805 [Deltaproteobacteria bacterium]|nr:MAG: hypothetical protein E6J90_35805 [Deltaproteobacteria bacterium]
MLHTLGDLGAPSRVRGDAAAHLEPLGGGPGDLGSRFERIAALTYGRLGVPPPSRTVSRNHLRDFFTSKDGGGLADVIARSYFSPNTLPEPARVSSEIRPRLVRPQPTLPARLNVMAANRDDGTTLRTASGVCLARYRVEHDVLTFAIDDDCILEQLSVILPDVAAYETGMLDFLLRGELTISVAGQITVTGSGGAGLGAGKVDVLVEDDRGVRTSIASIATSGAPPAPAGDAKAAGDARPAGEPIAQVATPATGTRVVAVFRGVDAAGEPIVAVGAMPLSH